MANGVCGLILLHAPDPVAGELSQALERVTIRHRPMMESNVLETRLRETTLVILINVQVLCYRNMLN